MIFGHESGSASDQHNILSQMEDSSVQKLLRPNKGINFSASAFVTVQKKRSFETLSLDI